MLCHKEHGLVEDCRSCLKLEGNFGTLANGKVEVSREVEEKRQLNHCRQKRKSTFEGLTPAADLGRKQANETLVTEGECENMMKDG